MINKFKNNDRVAFVGDSITHGGIYISYILDAYKKLYPNNNIQFFNCGVAGASIFNCGFKLMEEDVLVNKPNLAIIMYGMNDSNRNALNNPNKLEGKRDIQTAFENYKTNLDKLVNLYKKENIAVYLCTPTPYDEFSKTNEIAIPGAQALIDRYAEFVREYAKKNSIPLIDFNKCFQPLLTKGCIKEDHVHPNEKGHFEMAKYFLSLQGIELKDDNRLFEVLKWHDLSLILRDYLAAKFLIVGLDENDKNIQIEKCEKVVKEYEGITPIPYYLQLANIFLATKNEQDLREKINDAMNDVINLKL